MKLYFISNRINQPITGGEKYNQALLDGARAAGLIIESWEACTLPKLMKTIPVMNILHCLKVLKADSNSLLLIDMDFHFRYFISILLAKRFKKMKVIGVLFHYNHSFKRASIKKNAQLFIEKFVSNQCDLLITISNFSFQLFKELTQKNTPHAILHPFVKTHKDENTVAYSGTEPKNRFLLVGNVEYRKNVDTVLKALALLDFDFHLDIIGHAVSKDYQNHLIKLSKSLNLSGKVLFHGKVTSEELHRFYSQSFLFVLVSRMEGYGIVYAEAMKYGLPIVASTRGAVPEIVENGVNGLLCDPEDIVGISQAITKISDDSDLRKSFSENNLKKYSGLLDRDSFMQKSTEIFKNLAAS